MRIRAGRAPSSPRSFFFTSSRTALSKPRSPDLCPLCGPLWQLTWLFGAQCGVRMSQNPAKRGMVSTRARRRTRLPPFAAAASQENRKPSAAVLKPSQTAARREPGGRTDSTRTPPGQSRAGPRAPGTSLDAAPWAGTSYCFAQTDPRHATGTQSGKGVGGRQ